MIPGWLGRAVAQGFLVGGWGMASFCSGATSLCTEREQGLRERGNALLCGWHALVMPGATVWYGTRSSPPASATLTCTNAAGSPSLC